jgi:hypothetical protein
MVGPPDLHVTVDDASWRWADAMTNATVLRGHDGERPDRELLG